MPSPKWSDENLIYRHEISNIQNCPRTICSTYNVKIQGTDHRSAFRSGPVYGNYAIFVSKNTRRFLIGQKKMMLEMNESNGDFVWQSRTKCFICKLVS